MQSLLFMISGIYFEVYCILIVMSVVHGSCVSLCEVVFSSKKQAVRHKVGCSLQAEDVAVVHSSIGKIVFQVLV